MRDLVRRLERLEEALGDAGCACPRDVHGNRFVVVGGPLMPEAEAVRAAAAAAAAFDACPARHRDEAVVVRITHYNEVTQGRDGA